MKKLFLTISVIATMLGCSSYRHVTFKTDTFLSAGKVKQFELSVPRGGQRYSSEIPRYVVKRYHYKDSAVLYISLDVTYANSPNHENWIKCSRPQESYKCDEGQQPDGRYWREILSNDLVIGYFNVRHNDKQKFDSAVESLKSR